MSLPHALGLDGDRLVVSQVPALGQGLPVTAAAGPFGERADVALSEVAEVWRVQLDVPEGTGGTATLAVAGESGPLWSLIADFSAQELSVTRSQGDIRLAMPLDAARNGRLEVLDIVVDTDIIEITWTAGTGVGAARIPAASRSSLYLVTNDCVIARVRVAG